MKLELRFEIDQRFVPFFFFEVSIRKNKVENDRLSFLYFSVLSLYINDSMLLLFCVLSMAGASLTSETSLSELSRSSRPPAYSVGTDSTNSGWAVTRTP